VKQAQVKRLLNEYLDGEIGLAEKAELERMMAADPEVLRQYKQLRQIGMQLAQIPEIRPHPLRLRAKVQQALDAQSQSLITPQRVFAGAMAVALIVIAVSFGMLVFQQRMLGTPVNIPSVSTSEANIPIIPDAGGSIAMLDVASNADRYFSRLLLQHHLSMINADVLGTITSQTSVYKDAVYTDEALGVVRLKEPVRMLQLRTSPSVALQLSTLAEEVSGQPSPISVSSTTGQSMTLEEYLQAHPGERAVNLLLRFQ
jgi:hypothetical protein